MAKVKSVTRDELRARQSKLAKEEHALELQIRDVTQKREAVRSELRGVAEKIARWKFEQLSPQDYASNPHTLNALIEDTWEGGRPRRHALEAYSEFLTHFDSTFSPKRDKSATFSLSTACDTATLAGRVKAAEKLADLLIIAQGLEQLAITVYDNDQKFGVAWKVQYGRDGVATLLDKHSKPIKAGTVLDCLTAIP